MSSTWVQPPATTPGPETVGVPSGPEAGHADQRGHRTDHRRRPVPGRRADGRPRAHASHGLRERQGPGHPLRHRHPRLPGRRDVARAPSSRPGAASTGCTCTPTTASSTSSRRAPRTTFTLGQFFDEWGIPLSTHPGRARPRARSPCSSRPRARSPGSTRATPQPPARGPLRDPARRGHADRGPRQVTNWGGL